jgi:hypothetical protein
MCHLIRLPIAEFLITRNVRADFGDFKFRVVLPVTTGTAEMFAPAQLKNAQLFAAAVRAHLRGYRGLCNYRISYTKLSSVANQ